ncbi:MAG: hypothetical protein Q8M32_14175 [Brevundimonas sp.]|nr:hypothetical protein [Brevundimonas sp.]
MKTRRPIRTAAPLCDPPPPPPDDPDTADPARLAQAATLAAGRAMRRRRWSEARALTALAESYVKLGRQPPGDGQTIEAMDLRLLHAVLVDDSGAALQRMAVNERDDPADAAIKADYHRRRGEAYMAKAHHQMALLRRIHAAERQVRDLGGEVTVSQSGFTAAAEARDWLIERATELDQVAVTASPPHGDPWAVGL